MITITNTIFMGYRLHIDEGYILKPRWWDLLRHLGLRKRETRYTVPIGSVFVSKIHNFIAVRRTDFDLLAMNPDFPRLYGPPDLNVLERSRLMDINSIRSERDHLH